MRISEVVRNRTCGEMRDLITSNVTARVRIPIWEGMFFTMYEIFHGQPVMRTLDQMEGDLRWRV